MLDLRQISVLYEFEIMQSSIGSVLHGLGTLGSRFSSFVLQLLLHLGSCQDVVCVVDLLHILLCRVFLSTSKISR